MLPITPPPNGWAFRLPEQPNGGSSPCWRARGRGISGRARWKDASPRGVPGVDRVRRSSACVGGRERESPWQGLSALPSSPFRPRPAPPASSSRSHPTRGLTPGQTVTVSGHGLPKSPKGSPRTWFVTECTAAVRGRMNPATDTPHCDISNAQRPTGQLHRLVQLPVPPHDGHHRRRLLRHGRPHHVRHRRRGRPGAGHGRAHHLQGGAAPAPPRRSPTAGCQASCSHSRWL